MMYIGLAILALLIGSFLNVVIYRLPKMLTHEFHVECATFLNQATPKSIKLNLFTPRSFCPSCKHQIKAISNIPLISYLIQKGQCKHCASPIPIQYPLVEVVTMILSLMAAYYFGFNAALVFVLGFIWILIPLFVIDLQHHLLPDSLTLGLLWLGLLANSQFFFTGLHEAVYGVIISYVVLWSFIQIYYLLTKKVGMGNGDIKLFAALIAWFGLLYAPFILLLASITGVITGLVYLKLTHQSKNTPIPFGPFLVFAAFVTLFFGKGLMSWYLLI